MGEVIHLQYCPRRKGPRIETEALRLRENWGVEGDHHARAGSSRQVLLVSEENCDAFGLAPGELRENIVTRGIDLQALPVGTLLEIGQAALEITKDCEPCGLIDTIRPGLRARIAGRRGMLARVVRSGGIARGDSIRIGSPQPSPPREG